VEWENAQNLGQAKKHVRMKVPPGGYIFPAYDLNHSFADCGPDGNEDPKQERPAVCHNGTRTPPTGVPRIIVDLVAARPIDLAFVDGVATIRGGEGQWNQGVEIIKPGVMPAGRNPVCLDAVCMAVMGYDPRAQRGEARLDFGPGPIGKTI
jgi:hypothetical protein